MKFLQAVLVVVGFAAITANALAVYDRAELTELKEALRSQQDQLEEQTNQEKKLFQYPGPFRYPPYLRDDVPGEPDNGESSSECPVCSEESVCCRKDNGFQCCSKIYNKGVHQIEIDSEHNIATNYQAGGATHSLDFRKGLVFSYDPINDTCFVAAGIDYSLDDVKAFAADNGTYNQKTNKATKNHFYEKIKDAQPLEDHTLLPEALQEKCRDKPVYWHEGVPEDKPKQRDLETNEIGKRDCCCLCLFG